MFSEIEQGRNDNAKIKTLRKNELLRRKTNTIYSVEECVKHVPRDVPTKTSRRIQSMVRQSQIEFLAGT